MERLLNKLSKMGVKDFDLSRYREMLEGVKETQPKFIMRENFNNLLISIELDYPNIFTDVENDIKDLMEDMFI